MAPKRRRVFVDLSDSDDADDSDFEVQDIPPRNPQRTLHSYYQPPDHHRAFPYYCPIPNPQKSFTSNCPFPNQQIPEEDDSCDPDAFCAAFFQNCMREYDAIKKLKKTTKFDIQQDKISKPFVQKKKDVFTRFSVTYFSKVINSLDEQKKAVIAKYDFGSLIKFDACFVPNKFAKWVARSIDYRSGDIIFKDKVISLTDDSVHHILDLPNTGSEFPTDYSSGKAHLLSRFNLTAMRSAKYFGDMLIDKKPMADEDVLSCFLIVALCCFLCPNTSIIPANRYLGIFEDVLNASKYNRCSFVRRWLLQLIKSFNSGKNVADNDPSLGGCLYIIAVLYLDFVHFNNWQLPHVIPRVLVWKGSLIKEYSDLDLISVGVYGFRPLMDITETCYSKIDVQELCVCSFSYTRLPGRIPDSLVFATLDVTFSSISVPTA